jgi:hypothetical protein
VRVLNSLACNNEQALFMLRSPEFLDSVDSKFLKDIYIETDDNLKQCVAALKGLT